MFSSDTICISIIITCIALIIVSNVTTKPEFMKSAGPDKVNYHVLTEYKDTTAASDALARVNARTLKFLEFLKNKYNINNTTREGVSSQHADLVARLLSNYNYESVYETQPTGKNGTSYTIEKGEQLHMCLRDKDTGKIHSDDDIMFVTLHELAHMANPTWGHRDDYWEVFKFILAEAATSGTLTPIDYKKTPMQYCGLTVDYNPLFD